MLLNIVATMSLATIHTPVLWILGVILLIAGIVILVRGAVVPGVVLIIIGIILGALNLF